MSSASTNSRTRWGLRVERARRLLAPSPMSGDVIPLRYSTRLDPSVSVGRGVDADRVQP